MVKLADTPDLGSGERSCRFEPCQAHHKVKETAFFKTVSFFIFAVIGRNHCTNNRVLAEETVGVDVGAAVTVGSGTGDKGGVGVGISVGVGV